MTMRPSLGATELRRVFAAFPTGVTAIAALVDGVPVGLAASSFTSVSLEPPMVSVCVARTSATWPLLRRADRLGVSVLGAHQEEACQAAQRPRYRSVRGAELAGHRARRCPARWFQCLARLRYRAGNPRG